MLYIQNYNYKDCMFSSAWNSKIKCIYFIFVLFVQHIYLFFPILLFVYLLSSLMYFAMNTAFFDSSLLFTSITSFLSLAFCDEEVITKKHEEHESEVSQRQQMYSEQRKEMINKQVTSLHQRQHEQHFESSHTETHEFQQMASKEKSYSEFKEHSQFDMVIFYCFVF